MPLLANRRRTDAALAQHAEHVGIGVPTTDQKDRGSLSRPVVAGLVLLAVLSLADVAGPLLTDGEHPPMSIALIGCALGVVSLGLILWYRRTHRRTILAALILLRAASAVPAFVIRDVPAPALVFAALLVALTVVGALLVTPAFQAAR
jgi:hypothetical protein